MLLKDADRKQSELVNKLKGVIAKKMSVQKMSFLNNAGIFTSARETVLNHFKSKIFSVKILNKLWAPDPTPKWTPDPTVIDTPEPTPDPTVFDTPNPAKAQNKESKHGTYPIKLRCIFVNEIANNQKTVNNEVFKDILGIKT